jgi:hypothetical protein
VKPSQHFFYLVFFYVGLPSFFPFVFVFVMCFAQMVRECECGCLLDFPEFLFSHQEKCPFVLRDLFL